MTTYKPTHKNANRSTPKPKGIGRRQRRRTFKQEMVRAVRNGVLHTGMIVGTFMVITHAVTPTVVFENQPESTQTHSNGVAEKVNSLLESTDDKECWTDGDNNPMPNSVVYSTANTPPQIGGAEATDKALKQLFSQEEHGMEIYGFCLDQTKSK